MAKTITALKQQKRSPGRVSVYLDGEYAFGLAKIVAAWLQVGQPLEAEKIRALQAEDEKEAAYQKALHFLSYRPRSEAEVKRNLRKRAGSEAIIEGVIARLRKNKLVDDEDFARRWVENRRAFRPRGAFALRAELRQKGLADEVIDRALEGLDEVSLASAAAEKKLRQFAKLEWQDFRRKLSAHLSRRGFSYEVIAEAVRSAWKQTQEGGLGETINTGSEENNR